MTNTQTKTQLTDLQKMQINRIETSVRAIAIKQDYPLNNIYKEALADVAKYVAAAECQLKYMKRTGDTTKAGSVVNMLEQAREIYIAKSKILEMTYELKRAQRGADTSLLSVILK